MTTEKDQKEKRRDFLVRAATVGAVLGVPGLALEAEAREGHKEAASFAIVELDDATRREIAKQLGTKIIDSIPTEIFIARVPSNNMGPYGAFIVA